MLHLPFLFEALWYDEAAVIINAKDMSVSEYFHGLSWLQTSPVGYFLLIKALLGLEFGILAGRFISLILLLITVMLVDREYLSKIKNVSLSYLALAIFMVNSVSLRYATDVKPYTLELFLSISFLVAAKKNQVGLLIFLSFITPLFSSTAFIVGFAALVVYGKKYRETRNLISLITIVLMMFVVSKFVPPHTRNVMTNEWFGNSSPDVYRGIRSFVGGIFWLPTSGTGWIPDDLATSYPLKYELSALIFLIALAVITFRQIRSSEFHVLLISGSLLALFNIFRILPPAGRLIQGIAMLFSLLLFTSIGTFRKSKIQTAILTPLVLISVLANMEMKTSQYSPLASIQNTGKTISVYSNLETAPEIQYLASKHSIELNWNIISISLSGELKGCQNAVMQKGDRVYLRNAGESKSFRLTGFVYRSINPQFGYYAATQKVSISQIPEAQKVLECMYLYRNPEIRLVMK
jgi:hypothetical protein